jgi:hypothetical protein
MRFMLMTKADKHSEAGEFPSPEVMVKMGALMEEITSAGVLLSAEGLLPSSEGARMKLSGGKVTVTDGPFPDTIANFRHRPGHLEGRGHRVGDPLGARVRGAEVRHPADL